MPGVMVWIRSGITASKLSMCSLSGCLHRSIICLSSLSVKPRSSLGRPNHSLHSLQVLRAVPPTPHSSSAWKSFGSS